MVVWSFDRTNPRQRNPENDLLSSNIAIQSKESVWKAVLLDVAHAKLTDGPAYSPNDMFNIASILVITTPEIYHSRISPIVTRCRENDVSKRPTGRQVSRYLRHVSHMINRQLDILGH